MNSFSKWLKENNYNFNSFAKKAGITPMTVKRLCEGEIPNKKTREESAIVKACIAANGEVTPNDFYNIPPACAEGD